MGYSINGKVDNVEATNKKPDKKKEKKKEKKKDNKKTPAYLKTLRIIFTIILVLGLGVAAFSELLPKINKVHISENEEDIGIVKIENLNLNENQAEVYRLARENSINILIVGVDAGGYEGGRSDVMMIMNIDIKNSKIRLISISRDTLSYIPINGTYEKLNHSFAYGGAKETLKAVNMNNDLNVKDFVVFDYDAISKVIDHLGGYPTEVTPEEAMDMQYVVDSGYQVLTGEQATMYARIRYNSGGDEGRNKRQRDIIKYIFQAAKDMSKKELYDFASEILPLIVTTYGYDDINEFINIYESIKDGVSFEDYQYPFYKAEAILSDDLFYFVPNTLDKNVIELHELLFDFEDYVVSDQLNEINYYIQNMTGYYGE